MANLDSNLISVFPSTKRGNNQRSARLFSEENISRITRNILDNYSFVISEQPGSNFEFIINGYYFKANNTDNIIALFSNVSTIYAYIQLETSVVESESYTELKGQDEDNKYKGIHFVSNLSDIPSDSKYLLILQKSGQTFIVPKSSLQKYKVTNLIGNIDEIDGGEV